eukprot:TRINITY_DN19655_c0_g1_i2.p1 TRINITY_DN19655_c0_g1~~TRINITY_DN19655_c0_g1_i2.p1  ORF type:complete len:288 (+),score=71.59 TRINITY_DN19655_c0_g1_i2:174-1037(+)
MADISILAVFGMANLTVIYGAYRSLPSHMLGGRYDDHGEGQEFKATSALMFVAAASCGLMLMLYFAETFGRIVLVGICIVSCLALIFLVEPYLERCLPDSVLRSEFVVPVIGPLNCLTLVELPIGIATVTLWLMGRGTELAWVLNNVLAFSISVLVIASVRVTNLKVASVLLLAMVGYDIFWVYISPYIFHKNVMLEVTNTGYELPIQIKVPFFNGNGESVIGLGDMVLPGLFSACLLRFDRGRSDVKDLSLIHISEPTRLLSISYAVFCLKKKKKKHIHKSCDVYK